MPTPKPPAVKILDPAEVEIAWFIATEDGSPRVEITGLGRTRLQLSVGDAMQLAGQLSQAAATGSQLAATRRWLVESGVDDDHVTIALRSLSKDQQLASLRSSLGQIQQAAQLPPGQFG